MVDVNAAVSNDKLFGKREKVISKIQIIRNSRTLIKDISIK